MRPAGPEPDGGTLLKENRIACYVTLILLVSLDSIYVSLLCDHIVTLTDRTKYRSQITRVFSLIRTKIKDLINRVICANITVRLFRRKFHTFAYQANYIF